MRQLHNGYLTPEVMLQLRRIARCYLVLLCSCLHWTPEPLSMHRVSKLSSVRPDTRWCASMHGCQSSAFRLCAAAVWVQMHDSVPACVPHKQMAACGSRLG